MLLGELIRGLDVRARGDSDFAVRICDVTEDSRTALPGSLFIARLGTKADGRRYIEQAIGAGASAILTDTTTAPPPSLPSDVAWVTSPDVAMAEAVIAERFFGEPSRKLTVIGVTGTNGKSTTTALVQQFLNAARKRCGLIGTVTIDDGKGVHAAAMTTPPALELSQSLASMVEAGYVAASLEVSSHALEQQRAAALDFDTAVFTNLTGDHLDYHRTMEAYAEAKARLFRMLRPDATAIVNADDAAWTRMVQKCKAPVIRCSAAGAAAADCTASAGRATVAGTPIELSGPWGSIRGSLPLIGAFNVMNTLQAAAAAHLAGASAAQLEAALPRLKPPAGRLEPVTRRPGEPAEFAVFVDYAHTDDALVNALSAVRPLLAGGSGRLIVVFGAGGDKDRTKRPRMGRAAARLADLVVVTSDNPRTEEPMAIIREITAGIESADGFKVHVEPDRRAAIHHAVGEMARPGDIVVIAGKGHEDYQLLSDGKGGIRRIDFDDRIVAREALAGRARGEDGSDVPGVKVRAGRAKESTRP